MSTILISEVHNFTATLLSANNKDVWLQVDMTTEGQYLVNDVDYGDYGITIRKLYWVKTGLHFSSCVKNILLYCHSFQNIKENRKVDFIIWIHPLSPLIWTISFLIFLTVSSLVLRDFCNSDILQLFGMFIGNTKPRRFASIKTLILMQILGIFICTFYSNGITSVVTVPEVERSYFVSFKDMIVNGYKILWGKDDHDHWKYFSNDFLQNGLSGVFNQSFFYVDKDVFVKRLDLMSSFVLSRKALYTVSNVMETKILEIKQTLRLLYGYTDITCSGMSHMYPARYLFLEIYTLNRKWVLETYSRLQESGLNNAWDRWAKDAYFESRGFTKERLYNPYQTSMKVSEESIDLRHFAAVVIFCLGLIASSTILFLLERGGYL